MKDLSHGRDKGEPETGRFDESVFGTLSEIGTEQLIEIGSEVTRELLGSADVNACLAHVSKGEVTDILTPRPPLISFQRSILWCRNNKGIGYLGSSAAFDADRERLWSGAVARLFSAQDYHETVPLIIPVDTFYAYKPDIPSLVYKTVAFNNESAKNYTLILSGFTQSSFFTRELLESIPTQDHCGLGLGKVTEFGRAFDSFRRSRFKQKLGPDLTSLVTLMAQNDPDKIEDARLLVCTCLLLSDGQAWQTLWYENSDKGTPLYIVAPRPFHDAMNRLNVCWGHGAMDYQYRALNSFGAWEPFFDDKEDPEGEVALMNQGLSGDEFRRRITPLLESTKGQ